MQRKIVFLVVSILAVIAVMAITWQVGQINTNGNFWVALGLTLVGVATVMGYIFQLTEKKQTEKPSPGPEPQDQKTTLSPLAPKVNVGDLSNIKNSSINIAGRDIQVIEDRNQSTHDTNRNLYQNPKLRIMLFKLSGDHFEELAYKQTSNEQQFQFGVALLNTVETSLPAEKIDIRIEIFLEGNNLQNSPLFRTDTYVRTTKGWAAQNPFISQVKPAVIINADIDHCAYGHPKEWTGFRLDLRDKAKGSFHLIYRVSSVKPTTSSEGELRIRID